MKKRSFVFLLVASFVFGTFFSTNVTEAGVSVASLQKQIKALTAQIATKDKQIADLKKLVTAKDKDINYYRSYAVKPLKTKIAYQGNVFTGSFQVGNTSVPAMFDYKGVRYSPVNLVGDLLSSSAIYNKTSDTVYFGNEPNGTYMSDIFAPYYNNGDVLINQSMLMGGQKFTKGYSMVFDNGDKYSINVNGKYSHLSGILGVDDYSNYKPDCTISIYGDGNLLGSFDLTGDGLPVNLDLDISNVKKLDVVRTKASPSYYSSKIDFTNVVIN